MLNRLLERGKTSGREDDNVESIKKRFHTYKNDTMPVIEYHATLGKVVEVRNSVHFILGDFLKAGSRSIALPQSTRFTKSRMKSLAGS